jgi:hypothetical protein
MPQTVCSRQIPNSASERSFFGTQQILLPEIVIGVAVVYEMMSVTTFP